LIINPTSGLIAAPVAESDGANFAGVAPVACINGRPPSAYRTDVDASLGIPATPGPTFGDEYLCTAKTGITFVPGQAVYLDPGTATNGVTNTGTNKVGVYTGNLGTFVGDGVSQLICKLGARYPDNTLHL
jgi:hypothetical protein